MQGTNAYQAPVCLFWFGCTNDVLLFSFLFFSFFFLLFPFISLYFLIFYFIFSTSYFIFIYLYIIYYILGLGLGLLHIIYYIFDFPVPPPPAVVGRCRRRGLCESGRAQPEAGPNRGGPGEACDLFRSLFLCWGSFLFSIFPYRYSH